MTPAKKNLHDIAQSFSELGTFLPATVAKPAAPQIRVRECHYCDGHRYTEDGSRCFFCGGKGRVSTDGGEP